MGSSSTKLPFPPTAPSTSTPPQATNLPPDPWLCSSLLQKSIRRGDADTAADAGITLHRLRGSSIWRRFLVIAFEDIGEASPGALVCRDGVHRPRVAKASWRQHGCCFKRRPHAGRR